MENAFPQNLPPEKWRRLINEYASILPDTALRLKFTRNVMNHFHNPLEGRGVRPYGSESAFRKLLEVEIGKLIPHGDHLSRKAIRNGDISRPSSTLFHMGRFRRPAFLFVLATLIFGVLMGTAFLYIFMSQKDSGDPATTQVYPIPNQGPFEPPPDEMPDQPMEDENAHDLLLNPFSFRLIENHVPFQPLTDETSSENHPETAAPPPPVVKAPKNKGEEDFPEYIKRPIWLVEKTADVETYSNRLQIITRYGVENIPRRYVAFDKNSDALPGEDHLSTKVRGILYHASEGDMAPFTPEKNRLLKKYSSQLLTYAARKKGYHYLIDRFGRVYRIVREKDAAFHAGNSVWADEDSIFLNLNHAFIGICFEGKGFEEIHEPGSTKPKMRALDDTTITEAQIQSGKELTDWLRFHYGIPQNNCVPHGLASIYPKNRLIGYHLDLAHGFPFHRFGLKNKYREMIPSITEFGFKKDRYFHDVLNGKLWPGINRSEEYLKNKAKQTGISVKTYKSNLNQRFDRYYDWQKYLHHNMSSELPKNSPQPEEHK